MPPQWGLTRASENEPVNSLSPTANERGPIVIVGNCVQAPKGTVHRRQKTDTTLSHPRTHRPPRVSAVTKDTPKDGNP